MALTAAETCLTNIELVTNICRFLNYKQQLALLQVSRELKYIITNYVWNKKFQEVEVYAFKKPTNKFLVSHTIDTEACSFNRYVHVVNLRQIFRQENLLFESREIENFLQLNRYNIKKLNLKLPDIGNGVLKLPQTLELKNLTYLRFETNTLTNEHLLEVANNCLKLETLVWFNCFNAEGKPLVLDSDIDLEVINNMPNLRNFIIIYTAYYGSEHLHSFTNVRNILEQLKLKRICLYFDIEQDYSTDFIDFNSFNFGNLKCCQVFEIGQFKRNCDFINFQTNILPHFENLVKLTLNKQTSNLAKEFFSVLRQSCTNLTHLSLSNCHLEDFIALPRLQELSLQACKYLTWLHLKTILHDMHLKSFITINTNCGGVVEYFLISATLEQLQCDFSDEEVIGLLGFNRRNLTNLKYINWQIWGWKERTVNLCDFAPNLEVLHTSWRNLNLKDCLEMKHLDKIVLDLDGNIDIDMFELLQLLKHENLRELTIDDLYEPNPNVDFSKLRAFKTTVRQLNVCRDVLYALTDFCLELLELNDNLTLTCSGISTDLLCKIVCHERFPSRFKSINVCGISIDCCAIRNQGLETMDLIKLLVNTFPFFKCYFTLE